MVEWVQPKAYDRYRFPAGKMIKGVVDPPEIFHKKGDAEKTTKAKKKPGGESPTAISAPPEKPVEKKPQSKARPHPGKRGEIGSGPGSSVALRAKPGPVGPRTVAAEEAGRQARADLVKSVMDKKNEGKYSDRRGWRSAANLNTGSIHTGVLVEPQRGIGAASAPALGGRTPLGLPTRQSASTERLPRIQRDQTVELPKVGSQNDQTIDFQAIRPARTPFAMRTPIPVGSGRTPEQLALFHVPGEPVNPSLSTRQQGPIALPSGRQVSKLAARTSPGKKPGDQGALFTPARYRSVQ